MLSNIIFVYQYFYFVSFNSYIPCDRKMCSGNYYSNLCIKQCGIIPGNINTCMFRLETDEITKDGWSLHDEMLNDFFVHSNLRMVK